MTVKIAGRNVLVCGGTLTRDVIELIAIAIEDGEYEGALGSGLYWGVMD